MPSRRPRMRSTSSSGTSVSSTRHAAPSASGSTASAPPSRSEFGPELFHRSQAASKVHEVGGCDVDGADDPVVADVEDVDAPGSLLEVTEERSAAGERVGEDRAVHAAVQDGEQHVPATVGEEALERVEHAVEERSDR